MDSHKGTMPPTTPKRNRPVTNSSSSPSPTIDIYAFEKHPAHAARAKWIKGWEEKKLNPKKPVDGVDVLNSPPTSGSHSQAGSSFSAYMSRAGFEPCTPPRKEWSSKHSSSVCSDSTNFGFAGGRSPARFHSTLSPLAPPFQPRTPERRK